MPSRGSRDSEPPGGDGLGSKEKTGRERRESTRQSVDDEVEIVFVRSGSSLRGRIVDLSVNGCSIRTAEPFPLGIYTRVEAAFRLGGLAFRLAGVIQSVHDHHTVGIRFLDLSDRKRDLILELIDEIAPMQAKQMAEAPKAGVESASMHEKT
jgi:hypothetical protein